VPEPTAVSEVQVPPGEILNTWNLVMNELQEVTGYESPSGDFKDFNMINALADRKIVSSIFREVCHQLRHWRNKVAHLSNADSKRVWGLTAPTKEQFNGVVDNLFAELKTMKAAYPSPLPNPLHLTPHLGHVAELGDPKNHFANWEIAPKIILRD